MTGTRDWFDSAKIPEGYVKPITDTPRCHRCGNEGGKMSKSFKVVDGDLSDGYHTFDELYEHRVLLFLNLCLKEPEKCTFKRDYEEWFCIYYESACGQISYHVPNKYLQLAQCNFNEDANYKFDGHSSADVAQRLENMVMREFNEG